ncbi:hypothetical protein DQ181_09735 [Enterococcus faecium]|nr:hypothetical protein [Enterococcus faecium]
MNKSITKFSKKKNSQLAYFYLIQFSKKKRKGNVTKIVSHSLFPNKRSSISWPSILAQQTVKYKELFLFGCSYYLMQDSFFTTA